MTKINHKLGVIIPYRDRKEHLKVLIPNLINTLNSQDIDFELIIVEQYDFKPFNRGKLLNIGFKKAEELGCTYIALHDVDMIPYKVDYSYVDKPTHLATRLKSTDSSPTISDDYFGGVTLFPIDDFNKINGYSNKYFGWGYEDDDLLYRYRMNFDYLNKKRIPIKVSESAALEFNGHDSYVEIPKDFRMKNYTIMLSFNPNEIECDPKSELDEYSVFNIPGYDTGIMYNSFKRYKFETWNRRKKNISLNSNISSAKHTTIIVTVNQDEKSIIMYQDGTIVDRAKYDRQLMTYSTSKPMYLGFADYKNNKRKFFAGTISYFAMWNHSLEKTQVKSIYKNLHMGVTEQFDGYVAPHCLEVCYDMKASTYETIFDLSGNERNGKVFHCNRVPIEQPYPYKEIVIPWRRKSIFKLLSHAENGYDGNKWKQPETRKNQLYFNNEVVTGKVDTTKDGLSNLRYKTMNDTTDGKITKLEVKI